MSNTLRRTLQRTLNRHTSSDTLNPESGSRDLPRATLEARRHALRIPPQCYVGNFYIYLILYRNAI